MLLIVVVVLSLLALGGRGWGQPGYGYASWSPPELILIVLAVRYFPGSW